MSRKIDNSSEQILLSNNTLDEAVENILKLLEENSNPSLYKRYEKMGEPKPFYGVLMSKLSSIAKKYAKQTPLGIQLWKTQNLDAQIVAVNIITPRELTEEDIYDLLDPKISTYVLDKLVYKILAKRKDINKWIEYLSNRDDYKMQRLAWGLNVCQVSSKKLSNKEIDSLLTKIEKNLVNEPEIIRWEMNHCFAQIGITYDEYTNKVVKLGEELGVYSNMKVPKGCTSAYIPEWVQVVRKNKEKKIQRNS